MTRVTTLCLLAVNDTPAVGPAYMGCGPSGLHSKAGRDVPQVWRGAVYYVL